MSDRKLWRTLKFVEVMIAVPDHGLENYDIKAQNPWNEFAIRHKDTIEFIITRPRGVARGIDRTTVGYRDFDAEDMGALRTRAFAIAKKHAAMFKNLRDGDVKIYMNTYAFENADLFEIVFDEN